LKAVVRFVTQVICHLRKAPNPKHQITNKFQFRKFETGCFGHLKIGDWYLFGIWSLEFGTLVRPLDDELLMQMDYFP